MSVVMTESLNGSALEWLRSFRFPQFSGRALCADLDPEDWFPNCTAGREPERRMALMSAAAKAVCAECPIRVECLEFALESGARHGVRGGLDEFERRQLGTRKGGASMSDLKPGALVRIDDRPQLWRVVDFHGPLVRLQPIHRTGRIVHPERLTVVEASEDAS